MNAIDFSITGIGAWTPWHSNWQALATTLRNNTPVSTETGEKPAANMIPSNERRRAPLLVKLAVETSAAACEQAGVEAAQLKSVFASGLGDTQLTDYMCQVLAGDNKALSPTKFHNSVHNAAAGYWTISSQCMLASSSVAAYKETFSMSLLEAILQANEEQSSLILTCYDAPVAKPLEPLLRNTHSFSMSLVIHPGKIEQAGACNLQLTVSNTNTPWPQPDWCNRMSHFYDTNPSAKGLILLNMLAGNSSSLQMPLSAETSITIDKT